MSRWIPASCIALLILCVALAGFWLNAEHRLRLLRQEVHHPMDEPLERRAYKIKAEYEHVPIREIEDILFPVTVSFPDRTCVELRPRSGVLGGTSMACFSNSTEKLLTFDNIGQ